MPPKGSGLAHTFRGAKVAMTVALASPAIVSSLVSVDNAPADAALKSNFARYVQGMRKIVESKVTKQAEADEILRPYEEVCQSSKAPLRQC